MNSKNIGWGLFWVVIGTMLILRNFDLLCFEINWNLIFRFWPVILIFAGVNSLLKSSANTRIHWLMPVLIIFLLLLVLMKGLTWNNRFKTTDSSSKINTSKDYSFIVENIMNVNSASLHFSGGAAHFSILDSTNLLFTANLPMSGSGYHMEQEQTDSITNITLQMDGDADIHLDDKKWNDNQVTLQLNNKPVWDLDFELGAGQVDFDLSNYKIHQLDIDAGAASLDLKLPGKENATVNINAGASSIIIRVPNEINCELNIDAVLSSKSLVGFEMVDDNYYVSKSTLPNAKKINLNIDAGVSSVEIIKY